MNITCKKTAWKARPKCSVLNKIKQSSASKVHGTFTFRGRPSDNLKKYAQSVIKFCVKDMARIFDIAVVMHAHD